MSLEQEIKLQVTQAESLLLHEIDWLKKRLIQDVYQQHLLSTYFDTADKALMNFGVGLRLRQIGEQWLQTVKCSGYFFYPVKNFFVCYPFVFTVFLFVNKNII